ncbi:hypothetical protein [Paenibacillus solani]|uniref:Uncharacterized protein n=1 Tax=Paenibacillus solani TaxID=1705565 RepID=A0A0M1P719_9BACL|nr:hypothetical protein [Paenibacillus solani]KOR90110.1 hypothetical protein AM231_13840 [Paenibacillus solani]
MRRNTTIIVILSLLFSAIIGCTSVYEEPVDSYKSSSVHDDFPIPNSATLLQTITETGNPNIDNGAKYEVKGIGGEQGLSLPTRYFEEIQASGWDELEDKRAGHFHYFEKDAKVIALEIRENSIGVYEMVENAKF